MELVWIVAALHVGTMVVSMRQEVLTYGGNSKGAPCVFPHKWRGSTYNACHHGFIGGKKWCCTVSNCGWWKAKRWGYCDEKRSTWNEKRSTWNSLSVTFTKFNGLPINENDAKRKGWALIADNCKDKSGPFLGRRYSLNDDWATILIFDVNGHIAGTQMAFKTNFNSNVRRRYAGVYQVVGDYTHLTAYFTEPRQICDEEAVQYSDVVGDKLVFLTGKGKYVSAPLESKNAAGTKWVQGSCFKFMGMHYWYDICKDMNCDNAFPFFLLYNTKGKLFGWGYIVIGVHVVSPRVEHPRPRLLRLVFKKSTYPTCVSKLKQVSSQHVYFTKVGRTTHLCSLW